MNTVQTKEAPRTNVTIIPPSRLPWHPEIGDRYRNLNVTQATWRALTDALFPSAKNVGSILMVLGYCEARKLDVWKRPCHIVPMWSAEKRAYVDTVWPGIAEIRTTAFRTGCFAGMDEIVFGPDKEREFTGETGKEQKTIKKIKLTFPEWATITVHRLVDGQKITVVGPKVYWEETYATQSRFSELPNEMWERRKRGQLEKCAEAAALRRAFPEELGGEYTKEEVEGQHFLDTPVAQAAITAAERTMPATSAAASLDSLVEAEDATQDGTSFDPETGEIHDENQGAKPVAEEPVKTETAAKPSAAAAPPKKTKTETTKAKDEAPTNDGMIAYLDKMQGEFWAAGGNAIEAAVTGAFTDSVAAKVERGEITEDRRKELMALWAERSAKKK